jgi:hypothetical protein
LDNPNTTLLVNEKVKAVAFCIILFKELGVRTKSGFG